MPWGATLPTSEEGEIVNGAIFMMVLCMLVQSGLRLYGFHIALEGWNAFGGILVVYLAALISGAYLEEMLKVLRRGD